MKKCSKCKEPKLLSEFSKDKQKFGGYCSVCKECESIRYQKWYENNKDKLLKQMKKYQNENKEEISKYQKQYQEEHKEERKKYTAENKEKIKQYNQNYNEENKEEISKRRKKYNEENKSKRNFNRRKKYDSDINSKILDLLRNRLSSALNGTSKSASTLELLGCSVEFLKNHLEKQFTEGMNWDNYGYYGWHIDHIKPCAKFDLAKESEQNKCFSYSNLQPLWAEDNLKKGSYYEK